MPGGSNGGKLLAGFWRSWVVDEVGRVRKMEADGRCSQAPR